MNHMMAIVERAITTVEGVATLKKTRVQCTIAPECLGSSKGDGERIVVISPSDELGRPAPAQVATRGPIPRYVGLGFDLVGHSEAGLVVIDLTLVLLAHERGGQHEVRT